jgi:hypothetical protein
MKGHVGGDHVRDRLPRNSLSPAKDVLGAFPLRARIGADGAIEHLEPAEYHGDLVSGGVLCFHHFGWDLLEQARVSELQARVNLRTAIAELQRLEGSSLARYNIVADARVATR